MNKIKSLNDIIEFNSNFKTAVNIYLSLNNPEKILGYIPTKSSVKIINDYLKNIVDNKEQASLFVGPYGKGKSHLLLVLLAIISLDRTDDNKKIIDELANKMNNVDEIGSETSDLIKEIWNKNKYLPVLISGSTGDLNQAFLYGLNEALKKDDSLRDLAPDTYYSLAIERIMDWKENYKETFDLFKNEIKKNGVSLTELLTNLKMCSGESLDVFKRIYPRVTAGSEFNPMVTSDVLPLYKNINEKLVEEYDYSGIYIIFDEFSKFIESQDGNSVGTNMKLIQDVCELATESEHAPMFITMVAHKSIKEYGKYLSNDIINSFTGIEGRIVEKLFVTSSKNNYELIRNAIKKKTDDLENVAQIKKYVDNNALRSYYNTPAFNSSFLEEDFDSIVLKGCYPLNPLASYLLLNISEKVAQNERTLFTFISNDEPNSLKRFVDNHTGDEGWSVGADLIYDYFAPLFKKDVSNEYIHNIWLSTEYVLERCDTEEQKKVIKALAIVLIVNKDEEAPADNEFLQLCENIQGTAAIYDELVNKKFLYRKKSDNSYAFKTRAGSELRNEIKRIKELKGENVNYSKSLLDISGEYYVIPRKYNAENCITRYFSNEYMLVDDFLDINNGEVILGDTYADGKVITLYGLKSIKQNIVMEHIEKLACESIIVVCPRKKLDIKKALIDYEILQELDSKQSFADDNAVLKRELPLMIEDITAGIDNALYSVYGDDSSVKTLRYCKKKDKVVKEKSIENAVNNCCIELFTDAPIINNEMVNRHFIKTSQTKKSRNNIIASILNGTAPKEYKEGFNQEATIYRSLFVESRLLERKNKKLEVVINKMDEYITSCCQKKTSIRRLIDELVKQPYGVRMGVIPIYLSFVISQRHEDIIVYFANHEVEINADIVINMCENPDDYSLYVSKEDIEKENYIDRLNELFNVSENRNLSENRIKDIVICMQRWFRALPQATRNLVDVDLYIDNELMKKNMLIIKQSMQTVEINSFEVLFVRFVEEFDSKSLEETYEIIEKCKVLFDKYFELIQQKLVREIFKIWGEKPEKDKLYHILQDWYENQSLRSKQGLYDGRITNVMSCIDNLNTRNNEQVSLKLVKAVSNVYVESWNNGALEEFIESLRIIKNEIESIGDSAHDGEYELSFDDKNGTRITKHFTYASEGTGIVLRNVIEDTLDEYDDLSVNDRVSILLEMINKIIK